MKTRALRNAISIALFATLYGQAGTAPAREAGAARAAPGAGQGATPRQAPPVDEEAGQGAGAPRAAAAAATPPADATTELETVTVTGTRIRGGTTPSPVIAIDSEQIRQEGFSTLGEVVRSLPQNFNGGQNPGVTGAASGVGNQDLTGGSALNLRGLGADASLTLLNGRRMAYDGFSQAVDISAIPVEAVERLEIVADGASAIYGSDAVGGVANVILKRDFDGVALGMRRATTADGGFATQEYTATAGAQWQRGGMIATFKDTTSDPIHARQRAYTRHLGEHYTIHGGSDARSGLLSLHQALGEVAELRLDALRTRRDMLRYASQGNSYYRYTPQTDIALVSPSVAFFLGSWTLTVGGAHGSDENTDERYFVSAAGSRRVTQTCYCNRSRSYEIGAEGPLFAIGGGEARVAVGIGSREDTFRYRPRVTGTPYGGDERARSAYAELSAPLVTPSRRVPGMHRLELSAALRSEDYASFGAVTTPKLGVIYDPNAHLTLKASWGRSFKAPTLLQRHQDRMAYLWRASAVGATAGPADATVLMSYGGNAELEAERARTWTASLAVHPLAAPGLEAELTWFDVDYTDRVVEPVSYAQALSNPAYAEFVDHAPTPEQITQLLSIYNSAFYNLAGAPYDPTKVVAIIRDQYVNAARQRIQGIDLSVSYRLDLPRGQLSIRGASSWLDSEQRTSANQPVHALAGTVANPARFNGRLGAVWTSGGFTASAFANHTSGVTDRRGAMSEKGASFTTLDTTLGYDLATRAGFVPALSLGLSVQNVLNRAPPLYAPAVATYVPYDATNYPAIGRLVSASVSMRW
ncbi:TonB-dependent receptor [Stenotrophomonas acidaminiphila]|uniref:TonB-dependent receptor plug domain-containing protein n=1 Tax=Stenotrophomonas acidaminiphila TaxID=128780 RepID=UPI00289BC5E7|nr:TonB-dependent receptor [Stenotrophomonas acidaminiphila]